MVVCGISVVMPWRSHGVYDAWDSNSWLRACKANVLPPATSHPAAPTRFSLKEKDGRTLQVWPFFSWSGDTGYPRHSVVVESGVPLPTVGDLAVLVKTQREGRPLGSWSVFPPSLQARPGRRGPVAVLVAGKDQLQPSERLLAGAWLCFCLQGPVCPERGGVGGAAPPKPVGTVCSWPCAGVSSPIDTAGPHGLFCLLCLHIYHV